MKKIIYILFVLFSIIKISASEVVSEKYPLAQEEILFCKNVAKSFYNEYVNDVKIGYFKENIYNVKDWKSVINDQILILEKFLDTSDNGYICYSGIKEKLNKFLENIENYELLENNLANRWDYLGGGIAERTFSIFSYLNTSFLGLLKSYYFCLVKDKISSRFVFKIHKQFCLIYCVLSNYLQMVESGNIQIKSAL